MVHAVALTATAIHVPMRLTGSEDYQPLYSCLDEAQLKEKRWIMHALPLLEKDNLTSEDILVWAAYHALTQTVTEDPLYVHYCLFLMRSLLLLQ